MLFKISSKGIGPSFSQLVLSPWWCRSGDCGGGSVVGADDGGVLVMMMMVVMMAICRL